MNDIQKELVEQVGKFCQKHIEPFAQDDDESEIFRMDVFQGLGELGVTGMTIGEEYGGAGMGLSDLCYVLEEISKYSIPYAVTISVSTMVQNIINQFGSMEQKKKFLPALASGKEIGAFALTEAGAGSDAASLQTRASKKGQEYRLQGNKLFVTSGGIAKTYIVMARTGGEGAKGISAFVVRDGTPGFSYGKKEKKMGWKVSPTRELVFQDSPVPAENLLSKEGEGLKVALSGLDKGRITIGSMAIGLAQRSLDEAIKYALERKQFGQAIFDFQGIHFLISELATEIAAAKLLVYQAAQLHDEKQPCTKWASMAKLKATDVAMRVTTDAVQILGGVGYTAEYKVERYMRDAKVMQILEGTNQIQKMVIARAIKGEHA